MTTTRTARQIAASLQARSAAYCADAISYEALDAGNRADWTSAESRPQVKRFVLAILRGEVQS